MSFSKSKPLLGILLLFFGFLPLSLLAQNPGFENGFTDWTVSASPWTITTTAGQFRSGARAVSLATTSTTDQINELSTGLSVTVPGSGTNYITVIAWVKASASNSSFTVAAVGGTDGTPVKGTESTGLSSASFTRISHTFLAANGNTYRPQIYGRSSDGTAITLYYDDIIIYTSTQTTTDITDPNRATSIAVSASGGTTVGLSWSAGTDAESGIDGALVVRATGIVSSITPPNDGAFYATSSTVGPTTIGSHTVLTNGSSTNIFSGSATANTVYTYVIFMRDKAYNYSTFARIIVFNGTPGSATLSASTTLDGLLVPSGNTLTIASAATATLRTSLISIDGTITCQGNLNNSASTLIFNAGSIFDYNRNNSGSVAIPTATWITGSTCQVTGVTTLGPSGTDQSFANFTWNCPSQINAFSLLSGFNASGNFTVTSTNTGSLQLPAATVSIGGNVSQAGGTLTFLAGNTLRLNGTASQSLSVTGPVQTLSVNNGSGVVLDNPLTVNTALNLTDGPFTISGNTLTIANGITITRDDGAFSGTPTFAGNVNVTYTSGVTTGTELPTNASILQSLTINPASAGDVSLNAAVTVNTSLTFSQGFLLLGNNTLTLASTASISGANASRYVVTDGTGLLTQNGIGGTGRSGAILFPVGPSNTAYNPTTLTNAGTDDALSVRVYANVYDNYDANGNNTGALVADNVVDRTWAITEASAGGSDLTVQLQWDGADETASFDRTSSFVAYFGGGDWNGTSSSAASGADPYTQSRSGLSTFGAYAVGDGVSSLPITLHYFKAQRETDLVNLYWATLNETNNDRFEIERSVDGGHSFKVLATIPGQGNSNEEVKYRWADLAPHTGGSQYRIKQVDFDGQYSYSPTVMVMESALSSTAHRLTLGQYQAGTLQLLSSADSPAHILIVGLDGKVLHQQPLAPHTWSRVPIRRGQPVLLISVCEGKKMVQPIVIE